MGVLGRCPPRSCLSPNRLQLPYDREELLASYASFALKLGRLPAEGDLRLKARHDKTFPSSRTFHDRLGQKHELVKQLTEYCNRVAGLEVVSKMCAAYTPKVSKEPGDSRDDLDNFGFVYLLKSGRHYKIGRSNSTGRREYELVIQLPEKAIAVHQIKTDDPAGIELYWHRRFGDKRRNGEWFDLTSADVKTFKRRTFM